MSFVRLPDGNNRDPPITHKVYREVRFFSSTAPFAHPSRSRLESQTAEIDALFCQDELATELNEELRA